MSSEKGEIAVLIEKTEHNICLIQKVSGDFVCLVLNEWRYASRHIATLLDNPEDYEERRKAVSHLKRAYFDSCDILVDCLLDQISRLQYCYYGYADIVAQSIPKLQEWTLATKKAARRHEEVQTYQGDEKEAQYGSLAEHVATLLEFYDALTLTRDLWSVGIRKQKVRYWVPILISILAIVISIVVGVVT